MSVQKFIHILFQDDDEEWQPQQQIDEVLVDHEEEETAETSQVEHQYEEQPSACTSSDPQSR